LVRDAAGEVVVSRCFVPAEDIAGEGDLAKEGEVVAIALVGEVHGRMAFQSPEEGIVPDWFVEHGMVHPLFLWPSSEPEAGHGSERVELAGDRQVCSEECGVQRTADVRTVRRRNNGRADRNGPAHRNGGPRCPRRTGIRHETAPLHHRDAQEVVHESSAGRNVRFVVRIRRSDRFRERSRFAAERTFGIGRWIGPAQQLERIGRVVNAAGFHVSRFLEHGGDPWPRWPSGRKEVISVEKWHEKGPAGAGQGSQSYD
jgi:hypothetical protein